MSTGKEAAAIDALLTPIALKHMSIATLETRNSDAFDFYDVSVWGVKHALREAYCAGRAARAHVEDTLRILITSCEEALSGEWDRSDDGFEDMIELAKRALAESEGGAP